MAVLRIAALVLLGLAFHLVPARAGSQASAAVTPERSGNGFAGTFGNPLADLSGTLATLIPQMTVRSGLGGNYLTNVLPTMQNDVLVTVYQIGAPALSQQHGLAGLNLNGADLVVINVFGASKIVPNLNLFAGASTVLWNFSDASSLASPAWTGPLPGMDTAMTEAVGNPGGTLVAAAARRDQEAHGEAPLADPSARNGQAGS